MITIEIGNSYSQIKGLASGPFNKLRKELSYQADSQASFFSGNTWNTTRYCIDKQGVFATGLLPRVRAFLRDVLTTCEVMDIRRVPTKKVDHKPDFSKIKPYPSQVAAVEAVAALHHGIVTMPTGSGKSLVIALAVARHSVRTLIVVPSIQIREQLLESLSGVFKDMSNITVENIDSTTLKKAKDYDFLVIDEAHRTGAKTYHKLNKACWGGIYYRLMLTATPFRTRTEETMLFEGIAGQVIYKLAFKDAVKAGYIVPIEGYFLEVKKQKTDAHTWQEVYSQLVVNNKARNELIAYTMLSLHAAGASTLCLVKELKHGEILSEMTGLPFANGQDEDSRPLIGEFSAGKIKALIATTGVAGEGVDSRACEFVIIAGLGKAKGALMQQFGRALRTYPGKESGKVILVKENSHRFLTRHFTAQRAILLEEYGIAVTKLEV